MKIHFDDVDDIRKILIESGYLLARLDGFAYRKNINYEKPIKDFHAVIEYHYNTLNLHIDEWNQVRKKDGSRPSHHKTIQSNGEIREEKHLLKQKTLDYKLWQAAYIGINKAKQYQKI